jgi:hypothetical protein
LELLSSYTELPLSSCCNGCEATARLAIPEFLMKNLCLFLSMDAGLVSDTQLIYPLKIAESQL